jgi:hypothetical protein
MKPIAIVSPLFALLVLVFTFNACQKEFSIENGVGLAAKGSLYDSTGNCMADSVVGTFYNGVAPNGNLAASADTAYVLVKVNVTTAGTYNITSDTQNGFYFSDSGYFSNTGITTIKLKPVGTPIVPDTANFTISFDSSTCYFSVVTKDSTGTGLGGGGNTNPNSSDTAWKFTGPVGNYNGVIDTAYTKDSVGFRYLYMVGHNTGDSIFQAVIAFSGGAIAAGNYSTQSSALFRFANAIDTTIYLADPLITTVGVTYAVISYDATTNIIKATFTGTAQDAMNNKVNITLGSFTVKVQ